MHGSVHSWVADRVSAEGLAALHVLEVGSLDVNGSVRDCFSGSYVGLDMRAGPGVDTVANAHDLPFPDASFGAVVSTSTIEHDDAFWLSMAEMGRVLEPGGHLLLTMPGISFGDHDFPADYWRFTEGSGPVLANLAGCDVIAQQYDPEHPGIFVHAVRRA